MFRLIKQVFIALLNFSRSLATKCVSLINEPCMTRPTLIDLYPAELNYYPVMISLDTRNEICNAIDDLSTKICVPSKTKDVSIKVFNMVTRRNERKTLVKHISCDYKCKLNGAICSLNQKWNNYTCQCGCKNYHVCKKDYSWLES